MYLIVNKQPVKYQGEVTVTGLKDAAFPKEYKWKDQ